MSICARAVLFVEDDELVRIVVQPALADAGFAVTTAANFDEALNLLTVRPAEFCALVTDINLGGGPTGWEIARLARQQIVDIPVVYASGGSAHRFALESVPGSLMVTKPYDPHQVVAAVERLLRAA